MHPMLESADNNKAYIPNRFGVMRIFPNPLIARFNTGNYCRLSSASRSPRNQPCTCFRTADFMSVNVLCYRRLIVVED